MPSRPAKVAGDASGDNNAIERGSADRGRSRGRRGTPRAHRSGRPAPDHTALASNALEHFTLALKLDPKNKAAKQGIADIAQKYIEFADKNLAGGDVAQFGQFLDRAADVSKVVPDNAEVTKEIAARRGKKAAEPFIAKGKTAAIAWDKDAAKAAYEKALQLDPRQRGGSRRTEIRRRRSASLDGRVPRQAGRRRPGAGTR